MESIGKRFLRKPETLAKQSNVGTCSYEARWSQRLLVAKLHKIGERVGGQERVRDKDALDVLRLLRAVETEDMADRLRTLARSPLSADVTAEALELLPALFGEPDSEGVLMAVRAAGQAEDPATISGSLMALVHELLQ